MKKTLLLILLLVLYDHLFSQWQLSLTFKKNETIADISAPTNKIIWSISSNFFIYKTNNGGENWNRIKCEGLTTNISILHLFAVDVSTAFLSVDKNTGVGPGIVYKTIDSGHHWLPVFTHNGTCRILLNMFDDKQGLLACSFDSFNGSIPPGEILYSTNDGGNTWTVDSVVAPKSFILNLVTKNRKAAFTDYNNFYYSLNRGATFPVKYSLLNKSSGNSYLQFEDSNYVIYNSGSLIDIIVRRPGTGWINMHTPQGVINGAITGIILDGNECWMSEAFDTNQLYYSSDSAKTFSSTIPLANSSFQFLTKARNGKTLVGGTPSFMNGQIWINKREATITNNIPVTNNRFPAAEQ